MTAQPGTMLTFHVGVLAASDQALAERDHLVDVLRTAGVRVLFTDGGTDVYLTLAPADRTAPRPADVRRALTRAATALDFPGGKLRDPFRALIDVTTAYLDGQPHAGPAAHFHDAAPDCPCWCDTPGTHAPPLMQPHAESAEDGGVEGLAAQDPAPDGQCIASSWQTKDSHRPYGPGGYNRCTYDADPPHREHMDDFGNIFLFNPDGKPRVKVIGTASGPRRQGAGAAGDGEPR